MPTVSVTGVDIPYRLEGSGPALVLVPGTGPNADIQFGHLVPELATDHTVIVPDLSGSDPVRDDGAPLTVERLAEQVVGVVEHAGLRRVDLFGFSLGSPVCVAVAATRPDLVRRMVLTASWDCAEVDEYQRNMFLVWRRLADTSGDAFGRYSTLTGFSRRFLSTVGRDQVEGIVPNLRPTPNVIRQIELCASLDVRDMLPKVTAQTLVIGCAHDATVPVEGSHRVHESIPGSTYAEIDSGHVVVLEQPEELVKALLAFVDAP